MPVHFGADLGPEQQLGAVVGHVSPARVQQGLGRALDEQPAAAAGAAHEGAHALLGRGEGEGAHDAGRGALRAVVDADEAQVGQQRALRLVADDGRPAVGELRLPQLRLGVDGHALGERLEAALPEVRAAREPRPEAARDEPLRGRRAVYGEDGAGDSGEHRLLRAENLSGPITFAGQGCTRSPLVNHSSNIFQQCSRGIFAVFGESLHRWNY